MAKLKGITINLIDKIPNGKDEFGKELYNDRVVKVDNVLIVPVKSEEILTTQSLTGKTAVYNLCIPKGDCNIWENRKVEFFGETWSVIGFPLEGIDNLIPLAWNKKVMVSRYG